MALQPDGSPWPLDGALDPALVDAQRNRPFAAYVHIPFCTVRCGYCDFNTYTNDFGPGADRATYANSVLKEIDLSKRALDDAGVPGRRLESVFFGGGTPSLLEPSAIGAVIEKLDQAFGIEDGAEITLETNPETVTPERLADFQKAGVGRISVGMQSAVPRVLGILDRQHRPEKVTEAIRIAKELGLRNSLDLIYGAPTETLEEWQASLEAALELDPDHISAYSLIVEPGTKMAAQIARGEYPQTDEDLDADKYRLADQLLTGAGYDWYEISNFAKSPADRSSHNLAYWRDWDWWGYGPGAHSHVGRLRWWNVKHPLAYANRLGEGLSPGFEGEELTAEDRDTEQTMLSVRTSDGIATDRLGADVLETLIGEGLVQGDTKTVTESGFAVLTLKGRLLADYVTRLILGWE